MSEHVDFVEVTTFGAKTRTWFVQTRPGRDNEAILGELRWYVPWRRYAFFPEAATVFSADCLEAIATWCADETTAHFERLRRGT